MTLSPDRDRFRDLAADPPAVVYTAAGVEADASPLSAFAALSGRTGDADPYAFLLESADKTAASDPDGAFRPGEDAERHARYSYVGYDPAAVVTVADGDRQVRPLADGRWVDRARPADGDALDLLRGALPDVPARGFPDRDRQHLAGGLVGFLAYDAVYDLWLSAVGRERPATPVPDAEFVLARRTLAFDEVAGTVSLVQTPLVTPDDDPDAVYDDLAAEARRVADALADAPPPRPGGFVREGASAGPRDEYEAAVRRAKEHVRDGDVYQAVVSRSRVLRGDVDPVGLYAALRDVNPSPYMYLLAHDDRWVVGASPEALVSVRGREVAVNPIAGTCPRGNSPVEDRRLAGEMLTDDKELAEHTMLVDLARNDVRRVAAPGSVRVEEFMAVRKYSHVQHIESTVTGRLAGDADAFDAVRATFPAGTLAGAPKVRAMEVIDDLESDPRGLYGGGVGYVSFSGDADFAIVIRTATVESGDGGPDRVRVRAGAGVVADSEPAAEYEETERKMEGVLAALARVEDDGDGAAGVEEDGTAGEGTAGDGDGGGPDDADPGDGGRPDDDAPEAGTDARPATEREARR